ncbi:MAG TPA: carboxyltransferase domain-containing protein, partial [Phycisphaerales bacterium]|nr:carboxyltransferase domain-containing protein [Phycisphaerales bacterium]
MPERAATHPTLRWISDRHLAITWQDDDPSRITSCWNHLTRTLPALDLHPLDIIPSHRAVTILFDPLTLNPVAALDVLTAALAAPWETQTAPPALHILPACYDPSLAPDLLALAHHVHVTPGELITLHASVDFTVRYIGFAPGFPYLAGLPASL